MSATWKEGFEPAVLASRLESLRQTDKAGVFEGFTGFDAHDILTVMESSRVFKPEIPESQRSLIVNKSVFSVASRGRLTVSRISAEISRQENSYLATPLKKYVMATSFSITHFEELKRTSMSGCSIVFSRRLPLAFDRQGVINRWKFGTPAELPTTYTSVRAYARARTEQQAFAVALDALDLLRGIWNLYYNRSIGTRFSSGRNQIVNKVALGPLHTLHWPNGNMATQEFMYEADYSVPNTQQISGQWKGLKKFENQVRTNLAGHRFNSEMEDAIRRYVRAFDHQDFHVAFIELWGLLENLTATLKANYKVTISRTLFIYRDRELHRQVLNHLKNFRNRSVHAGGRTREIETLLFQLKRYVEGILFFHLGNRLGFESLEDAGNFLDLNVDTAKLKSEIKERQKALRLLSK